MSDLASRLDRLRKASGVPQPAEKKSGKSGSRPPGKGWEEKAKGFWERRIQSPAIAGRVPGASLLVPNGLTVDDLLFYDLETTGLSGGAGNISFLIGIGRQSGEIFEVNQLFLADFPAEGEMLRHLAGYFRDGRPQVSYNGRSFDRHVLRTRFLLHRMPPPEAPQIDLLYPARRLWKPVLPNCSLGTVETEVLEMQRGEDIPGAEVPEAWFSWLRGGYEDPLARVFSHNLEDIRSLARLLERIEEWHAAGPIPEGVSRPTGRPPDFRGMARMEEGVSERRGRSWLEAGWSAGDRNCGWELAVLRKREGNIDGARSLWERMVSLGPDYRAATELAKYWEHRRREPLRALTALAVLDRASLAPSQRNELARRRARLMRKVDIGPENLR